MRRARRHDHGAGGLDGPRCPHLAGEHRQVGRVGQRGAGRAGRCGAGGGVEAGGRQHLGGEDVAQRGGEARPSSRRCPPGSARRCPPRGTRRRPAVLLRNVWLVFRTWYWALMSSGTHFTWQSTQVSAMKECADRFGRFVAASVAVRLATKNALRPANMSPWAAACGPRRLQAAADGVGPLPDRAGAAVVADDAERAGAGVLHVEEARQLVWVSPETTRSSVRVRVVAGLAGLRVDGGVAQGGDAAARLARGPGLLPRQVEHEALGRVAARAALVRPRRPPRSASSVLAWPEAAQSDPRSWWVSASWQIMQTPALIEAAGGTTIVVVVEPPPPRSGRQAPAARGSSRTGCRPRCCRPAARSFQSPRRRDVVGGREGPALLGRHVVEAACWPPSAPCCSRPRGRRCSSRCSACPRRRSGRA